MEKIETVFFDLDGTLIDSIPDIYASINHTLKAFDLKPLNKTRVASYVGNGAKLLVERAINYEKEEYDSQYLDSIKDDVYKYYLSYYQKHCVDESKLYDGVLDGLDRLKTFNISMFVISNKPHAVAIETVKKLNIGKYFKSVIGDGMYKERKPSYELWKNMERDYKLDVKKCAMVGDGIADYEFAKNSGMIALLVLYGITQRDILLVLKNDYYFESFKSVIDYITDCL